MRRSTKVLTVAMALLFTGTLDQARAEESDAQLYLIEAAGQGMADRCECGDDLDLYERCLKKQIRSALKAFKTSAKYLALDQSGLREELNIKVEDLVIDCELGSEDPGEEDPGDDEEDF